MAQIYCDTQTLTYISELREKNPDFNLSKFVKQSLKEYSGFEDNIDIDRINHELTQAQHDFKKSQDRIDYLENQKIIFIANKKIEHDKKEQDMMETTNSIMKYYDMSEKEAEELALEYYQNPNISITKFLDGKGLEMKYTQQLKGGNE